jgi:hypothetical protein
MNCYSVTLSHSIDRDKTLNFNFGVKAFSEDEAIKKIKRAIMPEDRDVLFCKYSSKCDKNCMNCII